jgi:hypothetical protein
MLETTYTEHPFFIDYNTLQWQIRIARRYGPHVECEDYCNAPNMPVLPEEYVSAYRHWRFHGRNGGCAHGC